jgi:hypothetical protein
VVESVAEMGSPKLVRSLAPHRGSLGPPSGYLQQVNKGALSVFIAPLNT